MPGGERKIGIKNSKIGHTVEEVIVRRHADLSSSLTRSSLFTDSRKISGSNDRSQHILQHDGCFPPNGYAVLGNDSGDGYSNQQHDHHFRNVNDSSLNSLTNYCRSLRLRVAELESQLGIEHRKGLAIPSKDMIMGSRSHVRLSSRILTPITGPSSGSHHPRGEAVSGRAILSATEGNYFGSKKEMSQGGSYLIQASSSREGFSAVAGGIDLVDMIHGEEMEEHSNTAAASSTGEVITLSLSREGKIKRIRLKEEVLAVFPIGASAAATRIASCFRGFLCRKRAREYKQGLKEWSRSRCGHVAKVLDVMMFGQRTADPRVEQQHRTSQTRLVKIVYSAWKEVTRRGLPRRRKVESLCSAGAVKRRERALRSYFRALFEGTLGSHSFKVMRAARKELTARIRQDLSDQVKAKSNGQSGVVLAEEVQQALHRHLVFNQIQRHKKKLLKAAFNALTDILKGALYGQEAASQHWFRTRVGACFSAWSQWIFLVSVGLDRKRWKGAGRYVARYNQCRLDNFSRVRVLRAIFFPWKACHVIAMKVRGALRRKTEQLIRNHFHALLTITRAQRRVRMSVVKCWKGYAASILTGPFQAWSGLAAAARAAVSDRARLAVAYRRWKVRQFHKLILRTWRHQALYGRTDGLYSRSMLSKGLKDQRVLTERLEKMLIAQTGEMEECKEFMDREVAKRQGLEWQLQVAAEESQRQEMFCHHAEQEVKRIAALVEAMATINPRQAEHLKKLQPQFRFKDRRIGFASSATPPLALTNEPLLPTDLNLASQSTELLLDAEKPSGTRCPTQDLLKEGNAAGGALVEVVQLAHHPVSRSPAETPPGLPPMHEEDRLLLARAKWLVSTFTVDGADSTEGSRKATAVLSSGQQSAGHHMSRSRTPRPGPSPAPSPSVAGTAGLGTGDPLQVSSAMLVEYDETEEHKRRSVESLHWPSADGRMLLSFIDFFVEGDMTLFSNEDRRRWTKDVLDNLLSEEALLHAIPRTVRGAEENAGAHYYRKSRRDTRYRKGDGPTTSGSSGYASACSSGTVSELEVDVEAEGEGEAKEGGEDRQGDDESSTQGTHTWRQTLVQLRTLYPGGGNYSGMGVPLDPSEGDGGRGMCARLRKMRETQQEVMRAKRMMGRHKGWKGGTSRPSVDPGAVAVAGERGRGREAVHVPSFYKGS